MITPPAQTATKPKRDYRAQYVRRYQLDPQVKRKPRCPACGFTYSDFFPRVKTPVLVTPELLKRFARKGFVTGQSETVHYTAVGEKVYLCSGCFEQLITGRVVNTAPLPERIAPEYETEYRAYSARRTVCPSCGSEKGYHGEVCVRCASKRREARKQVGPAS